MFSHIHIIVVEILKIQAWPGIEPWTSWWPDVILYSLTLSSQLESKPSWIHHTSQKNSEIYEMIIWSCSLSYLYPQFIIQEHCKALKVLKNVGNHEELLKTVNHWKKIKPLGNPLKAFWKGFGKIITNHLEKVTSLWKFLCTRWKRW